MPYVTGWSNNLHKIEKLIPSYRYFQKNVCHFYAISNYCINPRYPGDDHDHDYLSQDSLDIDMIF